jgi:opacity protein-like surface antigen
MRIQLFAILALSCLTLHAQEDLMALLDKNDKPKINYIDATFKTTKVVIGPSSENPAKGDLLFIITHHFGALNTGYENLFGLKQATVRLGVECGFTDWLGGGLGLNTLGNTWDGFAKAKVLRQSTGGKKMPLTLCIVTGMAINTEKWKVPERKNYFTSRISYNFQAIAARKFNERLSLQIVPTMVHLNLVPTADDHNNIFSLGGGGRFKISKRVSVNAEYYYLFPNQVVSTPAYSSFSAGVDIETGGHVFQIFLTNSMGEIMETIVPATTGQWSDGTIFLGFNISRVFTIF